MLRNVRYEEEIGRRDRSILLRRSSSGVKNLMWVLERMVMKRGKMPKGKWHAVGGEKVTERVISIDIQMKWI
jgi:hypothetical protein